LPKEVFLLNNANEKIDIPLLLVARCGKIEVFRYLTEIGADMNIRDTNRDIARHEAASSGSVEISRMLLDKGMSVD
jgi:ankyrin repeat protein